MTHLTEYISRISTRLGALSVRSVGHGPTAVLWSSMFVDGATWDPFVPHLLADATEPRRIIIVDPPGLGRSEPLRRASSIREAAAAASDLLAHVSPGEPVDWVGNAFGGHVGFELARDPGLVRSLVAVSSPTEPIADALRRQIALLRPLLRVLGPIGPVRDAILQAMLTDASQSDVTIRTAVEESLRRPPRASMDLALRSFILDRTDVTHRLGEIAVPSLFVASDDRGDWDPEDARRAAALTPGARAITIAGARTLVPLERPAELAAVVAAFWRDRVAR